MIETTKSLEAGNDSMRSSTLPIWTVGLAAVAISAASAMADKEKATRVDPFTATSVATSAAKPGAQPGTATPAELSALTANGAAIQLVGRPQPAPPASPAEPARVIALPSTPGHPDTVIVLPAKPR